MRGLQCCRACLATDVRMCPLERYGLGRSYTALVGHVFGEDDGLPSAVCYECAHRLDAFRTFRKRGRRAHAVLQGLLEEHGEITAPSVKKIEVTQIGLAPSLSWCNLEPLIVEQTFNTKSYFSLKLEQEEPETTDIEVNTDSKLGTNLSNLEKSPSSEPCVDKLDFYVSFIPGPTGEDRSPEPEKIQDNKRSPKVGKVAPKRKRITKNREDGEKRTKEDDLKKLRVRKVKTENGNGIVLPKKKATEANKVKSDTTQTVHRRKKRVYARPGGNPRKTHSAEYYSSFSTVTILTGEEQVEVFSLRQNSEQYKKSPYQCTDCYRGFVTKRCYDTHRERHDDPSQGSEVCKICKLRMKDGDLLKKHIAMNHRTKFECKKCPHVCTAGLSARNHESTHADGQYPCASCNLVFKTILLYQLHQNKAHPTLLACPMCGLTYPGQGAMNRHRGNMHGVVDSADYKVLCECGTWFLSETVRSVHRSSHPQHADLDGNTCTIYCDFCEKKFPDLETTLKHRSSHKQGSLTEEYRKCEQCGVMLSNRRDYVTHYRTSHPEKTPANYLSQFPGCGMLCELCGKVYPSFTYYNIHVKIHHHGEKPFKCDICNKSCATTNTLKEHRRMHTKEQPYQCTLCDRKFARKSNFIRHESVHTEDAPFSCDICGKYYKYKYGIKYHIQYVHLKKPWPKRNRSKRNQKVSKLDC